MKDGGGSGGMWTWRKENWWHATFLFRCVTWSVHNPQEYINPHLFQLYTHFTYVWLVHIAGNPWLTHYWPVPIPVHIHTCNQVGLPINMRPKTPQMDEKWLRYEQNKRTLPCPTYSGRVWQTLQDSNSSVTWANWGILALVESARVCQTIPGLHQTQSNRLHYALTRFCQTLPDSSWWNIKGIFN